MSYAQVILGVILVVVLLGGFVMAGAVLNSFLNRRE